MIKYLLHLVFFYFTSFKLLRRSCPCPKMCLYNVYKYSNCLIYIYIILLCTDPILQHRGCFLCKSTQDDPHCWLCPAGLLPCSHHQAWVLEEVSPPPALQMLEESPSVCPRTETHVTCLQSLVTTRQWWGSSCHPQRLSASHTLEDHWTLNSCSPNKSWIYKILSKGRRQKKKLQIFRHLLK